ncbi:hypothetical protein HanIR_Chr01g0036511 [Helianthus annuus]|nr:hypothetical protein HanIR_Chr01g0036511 [Helianthus annuus]
MLLTVTESGDTLPVKAERRRNPRIAYAFILVFVRTCQRRSSKLPVSGESVVGGSSGVESSGVEGEGLERLRVTAEVGKRRKTVVVTLMVTLEDNGTYTLQRSVRAAMVAEIRKKRD